MRNPVPIQLPAKAFVLANFKCPQTANIIANYRKYIDAYQRLMEETMLIPPLTRLSENPSEEMRLGDSNAAHSVANEWASHSGKTRKTIVRFVKNELLKQFYTMNRFIDLLRVASAPNGNSVEGYNRLREHLENYGYFPFYFPSRTMPLFPLLHITFPSLFFISESWELDIKSIAHQNHAMSIYEQISKYAEQQCGENRTLSIEEEIQQKPWVFLSHIDEMTRKKEKWLEKMGYSADTWGTEIVLGERCCPSALIFVPKNQGGLVEALSLLYWTVKKLSEVESECISRETELSSKKSQWWIGDYAYYDSNSSRTIWFKSSPANIVISKIISEIYQLQISVMPSDSGETTIPLRFGIALKVKTTKRKKIAMSVVQTARILGEKFGTWIEFDARSAIKGVSEYYNIDSIRLYKLGKHVQDNIAYVLLFSVSGGGEYAVLFTQDWDTIPPSLTKTETAVAYVYDFTELRNMQDIMNEMLPTAITNHTDTTVLSDTVTQVLKAMVKRSELSDVVLQKQESIGRTWHKLLKLNATEQHLSQKHLPPLYQQVIVSLFQQILHRYDITSRATFYPMLYYSAEMRDFGENATRFFDHTLFANKGKIDMSEELLNENAYPDLDPSDLTSSRDIFDFQDQGVFSALAENVISSIGAIIAMPVYLDEIPIPVNIKFATIRYTAGRKQSRRKSGRAIHAPMTGISVIASVVASAMEMM